MTTTPFNLHIVHPSWQHCVKEGLTKIDAHYCEHLSHSKDWLPGPEKIFNAFSIPVHDVNYVLFGESPYPRHESANGYAFWDAAVKELWSDYGLSKKVNRATSLRNLIKMLLLAEECLDKEHVSQEAIAAMNKNHLIKTNEELFAHFIQHGFLLLNTTLVLQKHARQKDARAWQPFLQTILTFLLNNRPHTQFILLGRIAKTIDPLIQSPSQKLYAEHPYNHSFIVNPKVVSFFKPLHLLRKK